MQLTAKNLVKIYGKGDTEIAALNNVSLQIDKGQTIAIIGKSGSGKSTLMHVLAALDKPNSGTIAIEGANYEKLKQRRLDSLRSDKFGFIFQQFFLNGRETVLENVMLPLKIAGIGRRKRKEMALSALNDVDLVDKTNVKAANLSGGQKQRVAIARALVNEPEVIFADEPTGNLDSENTAKIEDLLLKLNKEKDITLVVVTHDDDLAKRLQRQFIMRDGHLTEVTKGKK